MAVAVVPSRTPWPAETGPVESPIQAYLEELHARFIDDRSGELATYIPQLGLADSDWFGICLATTDGRVYEVGDTRVPFTIQSMSKPFTYGLALQDQGADAVAAKLDVEPSGDAFNSISLTPGTGRPRNPMINAGAITATSLVAGEGQEHRFERILSTYSRYAGRRLAVDEDVFRSERESGHRNRAIGHMLRSFEVLGDDPDRTLELYFRQCAVAVNCRDMGIMAATLANGGRNPVDGERVVDEELVPRVLSVMTTCGMYDGSGRWIDTVGLPAKSGVAGGIFAVLPGQLAVSVFSPPLDECGNSVRGVLVCRALADELHLHSLRVARSARATVRASYNVADVPSRRRRTASQQEALWRLGTRVRVYELQGDLMFAGAERVVRSIVEAADRVDIAVLDLRAVDGIAPAAARMILELREMLVERGQELALVAARPGAGPATAGDLPLEGLPSFEDADAAREWCEDRILGDSELSDTELGAVELAGHALCRGVDPEGLATLRSLLTERRLPAGSMIFRADDAAQEIFLLLKGEVAVSIRMDDGSARRLATLPPGSTFGELAVLGEATRTADVMAQTDVTLMALDAARFHVLEQSQPALKARLLQNMLAGAYEAVTRMSREVSALQRNH
jgi:glutaminase